MCMYLHTYKKKKKKKKEEREWLKLTEICKQNPSFARMLELAFFLQILILFSEGFRDYAPTQQIGVGRLRILGEGQV